ncbi:solute carrier organic anion transporter family member 4C1-like [Lineus longissimus]|uniref:solute carrier organic anion transporter family member 4C1-like n=1 Tax=Lineus longissimus TaxID=88925 RepID=UPI002B4D51B7
MDRGNSYLPDTDSSEDDISNIAVEKPVDISTELGYWGWRPRWLQRFNNSKTALVMLCCFTAIQSFIVVGSVNINLQMLERRFNLDSTQVSFIVSAYDVLQLFLILPIGFFGHNWHKPRAMAIACAFTGLGSLLMALPHFVSEEYELGQSFLDVCSANTTAMCDRSDIDLHSHALYIFMLAQAFHGVGGAFLYVLAVVYIDENVQVHSTPLYIGIFALASTLGPATGFIAGGELLSLYVDVDKIPSDEIGITPEDPRWVGAWWISFLVGSFLAFLCSAMLCCLGKQLPEAESLRKDRMSNGHGTLEENEGVLQGTITLKHLPKNTLLLLRNSTFMLLVVALTCQAMLINGMGAFLPKFIQNQYNVEPSWAAMLTGLIVIPGAGGAEMLGGFLPRRLKLEVRGMIRLSLIFLVIGIASQPIMLAMCDVADMPGTNQQYQLNTSTMTANLIDTCNSHCNCSTLTREPICGQDNREYFSPCHAGCDTVQKSWDSNDKMYGNCSCISQYLGDSESYNATQWASMATSGRCPTSCNLLPVFIVFLTVAIFCLFMPTIPTVSAILRCVPYRQRSYAIAVKGFIARSLGSTPSPIFYGSIIDSACIQWQEKCGERGTCWVYDNNALGLRMFLINLAVLIVCAVLYFCAHLVHCPNKTTTVIAENGPSITNCEINETNSQERMIMLEKTTAA